MLNWIPWIDTEKVWHCFNDTWAVGLETTQQHFTPANHLKRQAKRQYGGRAGNERGPNGGRVTMKAHENSIDLIEALLLRRLDLTSLELWGCKGECGFCITERNYRVTTSLTKECINRNTCREWEIDFRNPKLWILAKLFIHLTST